MLIRNLIFFLFIFLTPFVFNAQEKTVIENNPNYKYQSENKTTTQTVITQKTKPVFDKSWSFGGNVGFAFWNGGTDILIAPKAYYHLSPQFTTGFGLTYIYSNGEYLSYQGRIIDYNSNSFGGSVSANYRPVHFIQLSIEYEGLQTELKRNSVDGDDSYWNNAIYLGLSFVSGPVSFGMRYDVLYDSSKSVYGSSWTPVIGFYF